MKKINLNYWSIEFSSTCLNEGLCQSIVNYNYKEVILTLLQHFNIFICSEIIFFNFYYHFLLKYKE